MSPYYDLWGQSQFKMYKIREETFERYKTLPSNLINALISKFKTTRVSQMFMLEMQEDQEVFMFNKMLVSYVQNFFRK